MFDREMAQIRDLDRLYDRAMRRERPEDWTAYYAALEKAWEGETPLTDEEWEIASRRAAEIMDRIFAPHHGEAQP